MRYSLVLLVILIAMAGSLAAQISNLYTFSSTTGTYTAITGTPLTTILVDNGISAALDIGFTFPYGTNTYTSVNMSSNGFLFLGGTGTSSSQNNSLVSTTLCPCVAPLWDNLSLVGGGAAYYTEGTAPNRIFTCQWSNCKWLNTSTSTFNFQAKLYETGRVEFVYGAATGTPTTPTASIGINMLPGGSGNYLSVTPGPPATASSTTETANISVFPGNGVIYDFDPIAPVPNDLACLGITGNLTPTLGVASRYRVTVRNGGTDPQSAWTVKIMADTVELASVAGTLLQPATSTIVIVPWTPATTGARAIRGKVVLAGDSHASNDQSSAISVVVQDVGTNEVTVGDGSQLARRLWICITATASTRPSTRVRK